MIKMKLHAKLYSLLLKKQMVESGQSRARELEARLGEHEARVQALAEAEAQARDAAAQETRAGHARVGLLETRLT